MGILPPDTGEVLVRGRMGGLVALGAGMHPHMTGRENIVLNGTILGMSRAEILSKSKDIADFADIGDFLDTPVTTYSSGMHVRLGFAIAIHCLPDVVVLDEVLAVGDAFFQRKCLDRIRDLQKENKAFILVSHNMTNIDAMCGRTLLLSQGVQCCIGPTGDVLSRYELMLAKQLGQPASTPSAPAVTHGLGLLSTYKEYGTNDVRVRRIELLDEDGRPQKEITDTKKTTIRVSLSIPQAIEGAFIWVILEYVTNPKYPQKDVACVGTRIRRDLPCGDTELDIHFGTLGLATGMYKLAFNIFDHSNLNPYTQGRYGYIDVRNEMPTLMRTGSSLPFIWIKPDSDILTTHRTQTCPTQSEVRSGQPPSYS
jgi:ABC-type polysaccharide/polyol phosphate transport system ATPase subunit